MRKEEPLPLEGITVVDSTQNVAGPYAAMILAEMGADVTKIEPPEGDVTRGWGPPFWNGLSPSFLALNRNKRALTLDLKTGEGRRTLFDAAAKADVFLTSSRPGAMKKLGLDYESLSMANARLVYGEITPFGEKGPRAGQPGYDPIVQALTGIMSVTGRRGDPPIRAGVSIIDMTTGIWLALGVEIALRKREKTDHGHRVSVALYEVGLALNSINIGTYWASGVSPHGWGSGVSMIAPYEAFPTLDGWLIIAAGNDGLFRKLSAILGHSEWANDVRFNTNATRVLNREELSRTISSLTSTMHSKELEGRLVDNGIPVGRVVDVEGALRDPQLEGNDIIQSAPHPSIPSFKSVGLPIRIDGKRPPLRMVPP